MRRYRSVIAFVLLVVAVTASGAQESQEAEPLLATYYRPGNVVLSAGLGAGFGWAFSIAACPGVEVMVAKFGVPEAALFDVGVAAKFLVSNAGLADGYTTLGGGLFGTLHFGFRALDLAFDYLDPLDVYIAIGLAYNAVLVRGSPSSSPPGGLAFASLLGVNYYLTERLALIFAGNYWGYAGAFVGIQYRLGASAR